MIRFIYSAIIIVIVCMMPVLLFAQTDPPPNPVDVPIDGGLSLLIAAGVGYAVKKGYDKRKNGLEDLKK